MSRLSAFVRKQFGQSATDTVEKVLGRVLGDKAGEVREIVSDVAASLEVGATTGADKEEIATRIILELVEKEFGIKLPASIVKFLINEAVLLLKGGKKSAEVATPAAA